MKTLLLSIFGLVVYLSYGIYVSQFDFGIFPEELRPENPPGFHDYRGATHVHTDLSIGSASATEVAQEASQAGQDFLFTTDVNVFPSAQKVVGYSEKVLVSRAAEYSYLDSRLLLYDVHRRREVNSLGQAQILLADLISQFRQDGTTGGDDALVVLAHPFKRGYEWSGAIPAGIDGIEVINLKVMWERAWQTSKISFLWSALIYPFNPRLSLLRLYQAPTKEAELWDQLQAQHPVTGFAGADASAKPMRLGFLRWNFPTYRNSFELASNHVLLQSELTGQARPDSEKIFQALKAGQFYMALDMIGDTRGFLTEMRDGKLRFAMGSKPLHRRNLQLYVRLPRKPAVPYEIVIYKDGQVYLTSDSLETLVAVPSAGAYRVAVRVRPRMPFPSGKSWIYWILSNPFYVR